jgi:hypothetical protein
MNFCTTCGARLVARTRFCTSCGAQLSPSPSDPDAAPAVAPTRVDHPAIAAPPRDATTAEQVLPWLAVEAEPHASGPRAAAETDLVTAGDSSQRGVPVALVVVISAAILVGLAAFVAHWIRAGSSDDTKSTTASKAMDPSPSNKPTQSPPPATKPAEAVAGAAVPGLPAGETDVAAGADITAPPGSQGRVDAKGRPATYPPKAMLDTKPATAWRMDGDGTGQTITVSFGRRVTVTGLALDPGFDKVDRTADRWKENRRISAATFTTDDGSAFTVSFATDLDLPAGDRLQSFMLPAPVKTRTLRVHIDATEPMPRHTNDTTAISRLAVLGS